MSTLDKKYLIKLDTKSSLFNPTPQFSLSDNETSDFNIRVTNNNKIINLKDIIIVMVAVDPNGIMHSDFVEIEKAEEGLVYCNLSQSLKNVEGTWNARLMCVYNDERIVTSTFSYRVNTDEFVQLNQEVSQDDRFGTLNDMLSRLSTIEITEQTRIDNENSRIEAEKQREIIKQKLIDDIEKLVLDTNKKVSDNLSDQNKKVTKLIEDTESKIDNYKTEKDLSISNDLNDYKEKTTQDINRYKSEKDTQINSNLNDYKLNTTRDLESFKNTKNEELDNYKSAKDTEIDEYVDSKNKEIDDYVIAKNIELDNYKNAKDLLINSKIQEVNTAKNELTETVNIKVSEADERIQELKRFEPQLQQVEEVNANQNTRLDKVEYANKRQDVMLGGLFNENADGRLSLEGTGNDVKLEGSKDGLVEVKNAVGNTLVNCAKDGEKEFTLNGDINETGTFVTTTEGVDNGKVDVMCEGNTLVNLKTLEPNLSQIQVFTDCTVTDKGEYFEVVKGTDQIKIAFDGLDSKLFKSNTTYTLVNLKNDGYTRYLVYDVKSGITIGASQGDTDRFIFTTPNEFTEFRIYFDATYSGHTSFKYYKNSLIALEGDYTNKEIPTEYFEGMKSVGECEENEIEFLSRYHYIDYNSNMNSGHHIKPIWLLSVESIGDYLQYFNEVLNYHSCENLFDYYYVSNNSTIWINLGSFDPYEAFEILNIRIAEGEGKLNKKQIILNEPLRALPNGVKDRFVKIDGKWYIERNCCEIDLSTINSWKSWGDKRTEYYGFYEYVSGLSNVVNEREVNVCCATRPCTSSLEDIRNSVSIGVQAGMGDLYGYIAIGFKRSELTELTSNGVKEWLSKNPTKVVAQLKTPTYELLEVEPTLSTYNDITHISNNSIIPCNMNVKNSGYECILKPNTKYTVLGVDNGRIGTSTILNGTITTPATIDDNVLRPYGSGKCGNVMLLEGTYSKELLPSIYFSGLKSCFEDGLVTQEMIDSGEELEENLGKYKAEVKVVGKNKFNLDDAINEFSKLTSRTVTKITSGVRMKSVKQDYRVGFERVFLTKVKPNTVYTITVTVSKEKLEGHANFELYGDKESSSSYIYFALTSTSGVMSKTFTRTIRTDDRTELWVRLDHHNDPAYGYSEYTDIQLEEGLTATPYEPYKEYVQTLYLDEPLYKDNELCVHDGKLGYWKNWDKVVLDGSEPWETSSYNTDTLIEFVIQYSKATVPMNCICDSFSVIVGSDTESINNTSTVYNIRIKILKSKLSTQDVTGFKQYLSENPITVVYQLAEPVFVPILENTSQWVLESFNDCSIHFNTNIPITSSNLSYTGNVPSVYGMEKSISDIEDHNVDMVATTFDMDYRLLEVEWALEDAGINLANTFNLNRKGERAMALSRYEQAKIMILGGAYDKETLTRQLTRYLEKKLITQSEYDELISLMEAKELVTGE